MVVCIHVSNYYCRGYGLGEVSDISYIIAVIWNGVSRVAVPIFFMISGALLLDKTTEVWKNLKRVGRIVLTLLLWSGIYYLWNLYWWERSYPWSMLLEEPVKKHLWFLYAISGIYILVPFLQSMLQHMSEEIKVYFTLMWFGVLTVEYILSMFDISITYPIPLIGNSCYIGYFILGHLIKTEGKKQLLSVKSCWRGTILILYLVILLTLICTRLEGVHVDKLFENRNVMLAVASALTFYGVLQSGDYSDNMKHILEFLSKHSFMIYLSHAMFVDIMKLYGSPRSLHAGVGIPLYTAIVFAVSLLFSIMWNALWGKVRTVITIGKKEIQWKHIG